MFQRLQLWFGKPFPPQCWETNSNISRPTDLIWSSQNWTEATGNALQTETKVSVDQFYPKARREYITKKVQSSSLASTAEKYQFAPRLKDESEWLFRVTYRVIEGNWRGSVGRDSEFMLFVKRTWLWPLQLAFQICNTVKFKGKRIYNATVKYSLVYIFYIYSFSLHKMLTSGVNYLWIIVFISCLDSDGTHSLQRIHWRANEIRLNYLKSVLMNKQNHEHIRWPEGEWIFEIHI